jgi:hypothetical protein
VKRNVQEEGQPVGDMVPVLLTISTSNVRPLGVAHDSRTSGARHIDELLA